MSHLRPSHLYVRGAAALAALALLLVAGAAVAAASKDASGGAAAETRIVGVVNVNTATPEELVLLPGVGPARAGAIIERRKQTGGFKRVEDLVEVSGIGERALERMRPHVTLQGKTNAKQVR